MMMVHTFQLVAYLSSLPSVRPHGISVVGVVVVEAASRLHIALVVRVGGIGDRENAPERTVVADPLYRITSHELLTPRESHTLYIEQKRFAIFCRTLGYNVLPETQPNTRV